MDGLGTTEQAHVYGVDGLHGNGKVKPGVAIGKGCYANGWMTAEDKKCVTARSLGLFEIRLELGFASTVHTT